MVRGGYITSVGPPDRIEVEVHQKNLDDSKAPIVWETVVTDRAADRAWSGTGATPGDSTTKAFRGFLGDRRVREYVG